MRVCGLGLWFWVMLAGSVAWGDVVVHEAPAGMSAHPDFRVKVNGKPAHVYCAKISLENKYRERPYVNRSKEIGFVTFDMDGAAVVEVEVLRRQGLHEIAAEVLPRSLGIVAEVKQKINSAIIRVPLARPCNAIIELNGDPAEHLYLFANPPEKDAPGPGAPGVIYFGPGMHEAGEIKPKKDGETIYLAAGAVVRGRIEIKGLSGVDVRGRGILDGSTRDNGMLLEASQCRGLTVRDVTLLDSPRWTLRLNDCREAAIDNVRILGHRQNCDGIDPVNCEGLTIRNAFIRNWDDGIVVKTLKGGTARRILAEGCTVITDHATSLKIGANEMIGDLVEEVTFRNCDVLHCCGMPLGIMNLGPAAVRGVRFEGIRVRGLRPFYTGVESGTRKLQPELIVVEIGDKNNYLKEFTPGSVTGVVFDGIEYEGVGYEAKDKGAVARPVIRIEGNSAAHPVRDVVMKGVRVGVAGGQGTDVEQGYEGLQVKNAEGVRFER